MSNLLQKLIKYCKSALKIKTNNEIQPMKRRDSHIYRSEYEKKIHHCIQSIHVDSRKFDYWDLKFTLLDLFNSEQPIDPFLLKEAVTTLMRVIDIQTDISVFDAIIRLFPWYMRIYDVNYPIIDVVLGILLTKQGKIESAIDCYQRASYMQTFKNHPELVKKHWNTSQKLKPSFLMPGFMRCGTTSLYHYLSSHPQVLPAVDKELYFFTSLFEYGLDYYLAHFPAISNTTEYITGEASAVYFHTHGVAKKVFDLFPEMKMIILLRNPIERTISSYHLYQKSVIAEYPREDTISDAICKIQQMADNSDELLQFKPSSYGHIDHILYSLYILYFKEWLSIFPREQFLILKSEDLFSDPSSTMKQIYGFLGLPNYQLSNYKKHNLASYPPISDNLRSQLKELYRPYNQELEEYLGMKFDWE